MGFVVLHMEKAHGSDSGTTAHIERFIIPKNADPTRTHLNRRLIEYPDGVKDRSAAIQQRLEEAGLTRKIGSNQVRAIRINVSVIYICKEKTSSFFLYSMFLFILHFVDARLYK